MLEFTKTDIGYLHMG